MSCSAERPCCQEGGAAGACACAALAISAQTSAEAREIRGLWIVATNTAHSWINQRDAREILGKLEFLVVQDMYTTADTARLNDAERWSYTANDVIVPTP